jgi:hypothetical protein
LASLRNDPPTARVKRGTPSPSRTRQWTPENCPRIEALARAVAARPAIAPIRARHRLHSHA